MDKDKLIQYINKKSRVSKPGLLKAIAMGTFDKEPCEYCNKWEYLKNDKNMLKNPCDECCHRNVCKHEKNMRDYIEEINKKPIPIHNDPITVTIKCGLFMPDIITAKDCTSINSKESRIKMPGNAF